MKTHNDYVDTFGLERTPEDVITRLNELAEEGHYVFRGYGKQRELLPGIMREKAYITKEKALLSDFEKYGSSYFHATTPIDFMSYGQHFGIPTRLLDFTHNPFIALSFALFRAKTNNNNEINDRSYYYIRYASLEDNICLASIAYRATWGAISQPIDSLADKAWECITNVKNTYEGDGKIENLHKYVNEMDKERDQKKFDNKSILFVDPNQANQRIIMQQGLFMFPYTLDEREHTQIIEEHSDYIMIHKAHREKLQSYLDTLGYNTFRLMPDLNSICEAVKRKNAGK